MRHGFLPDTYEQPGGGGYTKLESGDNRLRICSSPLLTWNVWENGKLKRIQFVSKDNKPEKPTTTDKDNVKHAWNVIVYNYKAKQIEVMEIDKASIISDLIALLENPEWGHPSEYDIIISKKGTGMDTEYKTMPCPKKEPSDEVGNAFVETPINLNMLLENKDPFMKAGGAAASTAPVTTTAKVVTKDNWVAGDVPPAGYKEVDGKLVTKAPF